MSELNQGPVTGTEGQPGPDPAAAVVTEQARQSQAGPAESQGSTASGPAVTSPVAEDSFFDPSQLPPELMPAYKQLQGAYTKKTQRIAQERQKIEAYDNFMRDPVTNLQQMAGQYGFSLTKAQARQALREQGGGQPGPEGIDWDNYQPKNWKEAFETFREMAFQQFQGQMAPVIQRVQGMHAKTIESELASIDPNWQVYEDEMRENLRAHPSLVGDVRKLYRLSVPEEVFASRATQDALKKLEARTAAARVSGKSTTSKTTEAPRKAKSFQEAVEIAKESLAKQGISR